MLTVRRYDDPADFLARAESFLLVPEAENALMLGICSPGPPGRRVFDESCYLATVENGPDVVACGLRTPPYKVVITRAEREALDLLASDLLDRYPDLPGVLGPEPSVEAFAGLWSERTGATTRPGMRERLFKTRDVLQPPLPSGRFRAAAEADEAILVEWIGSFREEAGLEDPDDPKDAVRERLLEGSLFVWDDGEAVSMAAWANRTSRTAFVNYVYTPPEHRGHGFASACVASLTRRLLDEGVPLCCLYTDLANPTSNKIYQAVGYRPVCDMTEYHFEGGRSEGETTAAGQPGGPGPLETGCG